LIEILVVIIIIGILSALAYSSLIDLISTNRAKESAQTMRAFAERALAEGKRQGKEVKIELDGNNIIYSIGNDTKSEPLSDSFSSSSTGGPVAGDFNSGVTAESSLGLSGIVSEGSFVACGARNYCAAAVKTKEKNFFVAYIKRGNSADWEEL